MAGDCFDLGVLYETGQGPPADPAWARSLYEKACERGSVKGCNSLGLMWESGRGGTKDLERARELVTRACDGGHAKACFNVASQILTEGDSSPNAMARARSLYQRACDGGVAEGCAAVAAFWVEGMGGPRDVAKARTLLQKACGGGASAACEALAGLEAEQKRPEGRGDGEPVDCRLAVRHLAEVFENDVLKKHPDLPKEQAERAQAAMSKEREDELLRKCREKRFTQKQFTCMMNAQEVEELMKCEKE